MVEAHSSMPGVAPTLMAWCPPIAGSARNLSLQGGDPPSPCASVQHERTAWPTMASGTPGARGLELEVLRIAWYGP